MWELQPAHASCALVNALRWQALIEDVILSPVPPLHHLKEYV